MNEERSMQFFLSNSISEDKIVAGINSVLNFQVETIGISVDNAVGFLQVTEYSKGFKLGCLISWPESVRPNLNIKQLGKHLAEILQCEILCEEINNKWYLIKPGCSTIHVTVKDLEDGIDVNT